MSQDPKPNIKASSNRLKLLIVEDEEPIRAQMKWALAQDFAVLLAEDRPSALEVFGKERPIVVTLDLGLPPRPGEVEEGFVALANMLELDAQVKVIIITGQEEKELGLKAIGQGAYDFLCKPIQIDELKVVVRRAFNVAQLERDYRGIIAQFGDESFEGMIGTSPQMQQVFAAIQKVAATDAPVLIVGESGTGKELVARAIHRRSFRRVGPFVVINCGAIPETLLESELFGHEKGAFTGAHVQRRGRLEMAQSGTLFLDEISELFLPLQVKMLRFLQEQRIERVGGRAEITVDARVLTATNRDLKQAINEGRFREDLYYRIGVLVINLPPLRERGADISLLAKAFLHKYLKENKKKIIRFSPQALRALDTHSWPGNVRELENRVKRAIIMTDDSQISPEDLELATSGGSYRKKKLKEAREVLERELIKRSIVRNKGNLTRVSEDLGISRPTLYEMIEKLGIKN